MHLTLEEVINRIRKAPQPDKRTDKRTQENPNRPEFYIPRTTRKFVNFLSST